MARLCAMTTSNDIPLAASPIDRAAHHRTDERWLANARKNPDGLVCLLQGGNPMLEGGRGVTQSGPGMFRDGPAKPLVWLGPEAWRLPVQREVFLGKDKHGAPVFALDLPMDFALTGSLIEGAGEFEDMRSAAGILSPLEANCASTARSLFEWHRKHQFCANCGAPSEVTEAGWKRTCPACGTEHFPRTDPVAIMMAVKGDRCLLGRGKGWPPGFISCLAGFVEPGETVEQAAAREIFEEAGVRCDPASAEFLFCQPWPFPSSLMMGLILDADTEAITIDPNEIESAHWITRDEARQMLAGTHPRWGCPPPMAIAHHVLKAWAVRER
ncbi:MAG: NAD(+) diphosphatase [Pseudomonadota bacterium]